MSISLSEKTRAVLLNVLGISQLSDVLDKDFHDLSATNDVCRSKVSIYGDRNRGSVRLNSGHYYTVSEFEERLRQVKLTPLP